MENHPVDKVDVSSGAAGHTETRSGHTTSTVQASVQLVEALEAMLDAVCCSLAAGRYCVAYNIAREFDLHRPDIHTTLSSEFVLQCTAKLTTEDVRKLSPSKWHAAVELIRWLQVCQVEGGVEVVRERPPSVTPVTGGRAWKAAVYQAASWIAGYWRSTPATPPPRNQQHNVVASTLSQILPHCLALRVTRAKKAVELLLSHRETSDDNRGTSLRQQLEALHDLEKVLKSLHSEEGVCFIADDPNEGEGQTLTPATSASRFSDNGSRAGRGLHLKSQMLLNIANEPASPALISLLDWMEIEAEIDGYETRIREIRGTPMRRHGGAPNGVPRGLQEEARPRFSLGNLAPNARRLYLGNICAAREALSELTRRLSRVPDPRAPELPTT